MFIACGHEIVGGGTQGRERERMQGQRNKMHSLVMHFMEESQSRESKAGVVSARSHRLAGHVVNLIWFIFICCAHFFFFISLSFVGHFPLAVAASTATAAAAVASSKLKRLLLAMRPLGQVYCDGSHKFHFYLRQLTTLTPQHTPLLRLWPCLL